MAWFKYLKSSEEVNEVVKNENYSYPYVKRMLPQFTPQDTLTEAMWMSVDLEDLNIGKFTTSTLESTLDHSSYLVVYESDELGEAFLPTKCIIDENNILYFQAPTTHLAQLQIFGRYALYYHTPNIRYIKPIQNGPEEDDVSGWDVQVDYQVTSAVEAAGFFAASISDVENLTFEVNFESETTYNFSFLNSNTDWTNGETSYPWAKMYISFSGPYLEIYGSRGPDFGKVSLTITALASNDDPISKTIAQDVIVDCFTQAPEEDVVIYSLDPDDLESRDYVIEIKILKDNNVLSTGNRFKVTRYKFNYNIDLDLESEQVVSSLNLASSGFFKG